MALAAPMPSLVGLGDVAAVGAGAVAEHLGVDPGAAGLGVLQLLEHQHAGAFAEHEAVAVAVERPAGALADRRSARDRARMVAKPLMPMGVSGGLGAAGDHHVGLVVLDGLEGVADGVGGAGAGGGHGGVRARAGRTGSRAGRWRR